uniref:Uncharacterized protein n=1 Tax=Rhizophora mucronata TaxID=61149 RepID=A0A2P2N6U0_RHIMU
MFLPMNSVVARKTIFVVTCRTYWVF